MKFTTRDLPARKNLALVAHDNMKPVLTAWAQSNLAYLRAHQLFATGTTGALLQAAIGLPVTRLLSGPLGGDQQIGAMIATGDIHALVFMWDPFEPLPHDPDIKALLRVAAVWNVPLACNLATAEVLIHSDAFAQTQRVRVPDMQAYQNARR